MSDETQTNDLDQKITAADIEQFTGKSRAEINGEVELTKEKPKVEIPSEPFADLNSPSVDKAIQDAVAIQKAIELTDLEKETFLKSVLHDEPFELPITTGYGLTFVFKTRTTTEQKLIISAVEAHEPSSQYGLADSFTLAQKYLMVTSLKEIAGETFPTFDLLPHKNKPAKEIKELLDEALETHLEWDELKWNIAFMALATFEGKKQKLLDESFNENFWKHED
jgi:hypothetical protein